MNFYCLKLYKSVRSNLELRDRTCRLDTISIRIEVDRILNIMQTKESISVRALQVPYSEHSSFTEMDSFVKWLGPRRVIPSVNNDCGPKCRKMLSLLGVQG